MNTIRVSNNLDSDQARHFVGPDLGPKFQTVCKGYQQRTKVDTRRERVKVPVTTTADNILFCLFFFKKI